MKDKLETAIKDLDALLRSTWKAGDRSCVTAADMVSTAQCATADADYGSARQELRAVDRSVWMRSVRASTLTVQQALKLARVEASLSAAITP
jgi:hypothetical protein